MKPNKENSMLIDIQYIRADRANSTKDVLYVIWKDLDTGEKYLQITEEPRMDIYFSKPEKREFTHNKNYEHIENLDKVRVKYKDIQYAIANDMGPSGDAMIQNAFQTRNYNNLRKLQLHPYVFGSDYDIRAWFRAQWLLRMDNNRTKKLTKGFLDIEADSYKVEGMPTPADCPINAVTLIDASTKQVYTFLLIENREDDPLIIDFIEHVEEFKQELHEAFDEFYGKLEYNIYFYKRERVMIKHIFDLINSLKLDMIGIWNISFDIPYLMDRISHLGEDPADVICHKDFPVKKCEFKKDMINFSIKNKSDFFFCSSYTIFYDQMIQYAAIRKGQTELRSHALSYVSRKELKDDKLNYSEDGDFKTLPYRNFKRFVMYNIKDVLLQYGIENKTSDFDTLYTSSYKNATPYDAVFKQTVKLRNVQYVAFAKQGLVPGNNVNIFNAYSRDDTASKKSLDDDEDDDDSEGFEGALVSKPENNAEIGMPLYGVGTNYIFRNVIDEDMASFYPNEIISKNIDASTLIFKCIIPKDQYKKGEVIINTDNRDLEDDLAKEMFDNYQTKNYLSTGTKWFNLPSVDEVYGRLTGASKKHDWYSALPDTLPGIISHGKE